jgi:hypothetical protein
VLDDCNVVVFQLKTKFEKDSVSFHRFLDGKLLSKVSVMSPVQNLERLLFQVKFILADFDGLLSGNE